MMSSRNPFLGIHHLRLGAYCKWYKNHKKLQLVIVKFYLHHLWLCKHTHSRSLLKYGLQSSFVFIKPRSGVLWSNHQIRSVATFCDVAVYKGKMSSDGTCTEQETALSKVLVSCVSDSSLSISILASSWCTLSGRIQDKVPLWKHSAERATKMVSVWCTLFKGWMQ